MRLFRAPREPESHEAFQEEKANTQFGESTSASSLRPLRLAGIILGLWLFVFFVLAIAEASSGASCQWKFPKWFGCVLSSHENLAAGLIGASGALLAAWIAWTAVQRQINADRERMLVDRVEVEQILADKMMYFAEGVAAAWRLLDNLSEQTDAETIGRVREATAYMAERVSQPEQIASYRVMVDTLGWDRRRKYTELINGLEGLKDFSDKDASWNNEEPLWVIRRLADDFEQCVPGTSEYFSGLWRRSPKAWTFGTYVNRIAGVH